MISFRSKVCMCVERKICNTSMELLLKYAFALECFAKTLKRKGLFSSFFRQKDPFFGKTEKIGHSCQCFFTFLKSELTWLDQKRKWSFFQKCHFSEKVRFYPRHILTVVQGNTFTPREISWKNRRNCITGWVRVTYWSLTYRRFWIWNDSLYPLNYGCTISLFAEISKSMSNLNKVGYVY